MRSYVSLNWTGQPIGPDQQLVVMKVAAHYLRSDHKKSWADFTHELLDGRLKHTSFGALGSVVGNFFHADLGTVKGVPWTLDFMLTSGAEAVLLNHDLAFSCTFETEDGISVEYRTDPAITRVGKESLLG